MTILHVLNTGSFSGAENVVVTLIEGFRKYDKENIKFIYVSLNGSIRDVLQDRCIEFEPIEKMTRSEIHRVVKKPKCPSNQENIWKTSLTSKKWMRKL